MEEQEIIELLSNRQLNIKTNNLIITNIDDFSIIDEIPAMSPVHFTHYDIDVDFTINVVVDLKQVDIKDILSYVLNYLKELKMIDENFDYTIDFNNKFDILKFQKILRTYNKVVQMIFKNVECLDEEQNMLFNELYYYNSPFYMVVSFVNSNFKTYFLTQDRVLDYREDYTKIEKIDYKTFKKMFVEEKSRKD